MVTAPPPSPNDPGAPESSAGSSELERISGLLLLDAIESVERRLGAHDRKLDRIERAVRILAHGTSGPFPQPVGLPALRELGDLPPAGP